jgi:hypothetical protein
VGCPVSLTDRQRALLHEFGANPLFESDWREDDGLCADRSGDFVDLARLRGHVAELTVLDGNPHGRGSPIHCVVLLDSSVLVDWTPRQYDPNADFPALDTPEGRFGWTSLKPASRA